MTMVMLWVLIIDYKGHAPSKMLSPEYCEQFKQLVADFAFDIK